MATTSETEDTTAPTSEEVTLKLQVCQGPSRERARDAHGSRFEQLVYSPITVLTNHRSQDLLRTMMGVLLGSGQQAFPDQKMSLRVDGLTWTDRERLEAKITGVCTFIGDGNRVWIPYEADVCTQKRTGEIRLALRQTELGEIHKAADAIKKWRAETK